MLNTTEKQRLRSLERKIDNLEFQLEAVSEKRAKLDYYEKQLLEQISNLKQEAQPLLDKKSEEDSK